MQRFSKLVERKGLHVVLNVWTFVHWIRPGERTKLGRRHAQWATPAQRVIKSHSEPIKNGGIAFIQSLDARDPENHSKLQMIVQVCTDSGPVEHNGNSELRELTRGPNSGKHH